MKQLIIILLLFNIFLNNFNNAFASSNNSIEKERIKIMNTLDAEAKVEEISIKLLELFDGRSISINEQNRVIEEIRKSFNENRNNLYFRTAGIVKCNYIKNQFDKNYQPKPENATSNDPQTKLLYEVSKLEEILEDKIE